MRGGRLRGARCACAPAWADLHPKVRAHEGRGSRGPLPIVVGTLVLVEVEQRLPRGERRREPRVLWLCGGMVRENPISVFFYGGRTSGASTWSIHLPLPQTDFLGWST
jgi:hypothetical protein